MKHITKKQKKGRSTNVNELIYGAHPIIEALKAGKRKLESIYTTKPFPKGWRRVEQFLPKKPVTINYIPRESLTRMAGTTDHMGIIAWMSLFPFKKELFNPLKAPKILLLDAVQDVRNLGAIIRSAHCTCFDGIVLCKGNSAPLGPATLKASAGLTEHMSIFIAPSMAWAAQELKKSGYNLYMAVLENGVDTRTQNFEGPTCIVIGNEATGISP
ncbi:RNA methyltransferase, partial [Candidatus Babeliales bacterium]|nr:RNA methyltransferase [Candidatus Babeliales bacterium]